MLLQYLQQRIQGNNAINSAKEAEITARLLPLEKPENENEDLYLWRKFIYMHYVRR